jgi:hypothetical protein
MFAFLFALPRNQRRTDGDEVVSTSRFHEIGTVKARFFEASFLRTETMHFAGKDFTLRQANKIEARKVANEREKQTGGADSMTGTARQGKATYCGTTCYGTTHYGTSYYAKVSSSATRQTQALRAASRRVTSGIRCVHGVECVLGSTSP